MEKMLSHPFLYLLTLLPIFVILFHSCEGDVTVSPALACVGEQVRVQCSLNAPNGDMFVSPEIMFIVGNSDTPLTENDVNNGVGDPLNRLTAFGDISSSSTLLLIGSMNLSSFTSSDDGLRIGCSGRYQPGGTGAAINFIQTANLTAAAPPSTPTNTAVSLSSLSAANCTNTLISWTAPVTTDRSIDRYYLYRNSSLIAVTTDTSYTDTDQLMVDTNYRYSVVANSCAGNSSEGVKSTVIKGYSLVNTGPSSLYVNFIASNMQLTLDWSLSPAADTLLLNYSLALNYTVNETVDETVYEFTNSAFSLLSDASTYSVLLTPPSFPTPAVFPNITACINITSQCGMAFSGEMLCGFFNSENPPTTTQPTQPTIATTSNELTSTSPILSTTISNTNATIVPTQGPFPIAIIAGAVGGAGALLFILILILVIIMLCICCGKKSNDSKYPSRRSDDHVELAAQSQSTDNIQSEAMYTQVNKPQRGPQQSDLYSSVHKQPPQQKELLYADLDHVTSQSDRVYPPVVPHTQYTDLAQFPRADQTLYASVHTDGPN